jgi:cupin superfamily acireductone dioxygenase involved in methionine salvage
MFGMMRMFSVFAEKNFQAIRVFRGTAEAEAWLTPQQGKDETRSLS